MAQLIINGVFLFLFVIYLLLIYKGYFNRRCGHECWVIGRPTEHCKSGKKVFTYWQRWKATYEEMEKLKEAKMQAEQELLELLESSAAIEKQIRDKRAEADSYTMDYRQKCEEANNA